MHISVIARKKQTSPDQWTIVNLSPPTLLELDSARNRKVRGLFFVDVLPFIEDAYALCHVRA